MAIQITGANQAYIPATEKGQPGGVPQLDQSGHLLPTQLGSGRSGQGTRFLREDGIFALPGTTAPPAPTTSQFLVAVPGTATGGVAFSFTVTAQKQDGTTDTTYTGSVTISSTDTPATDFPFTYTFVAGDNGSKTFSKKLVTGGAQVITVSDPSYGIQSSSSGITVTVTTTWDPNTISGLTVWVRGHAQSEADGASVVTVLNQRSGGTAFTAVAGDSSKRPTLARNVIGTNARHAIRFTPPNQSVIGQILDIHAGFTLVITGRVRTLAANGTYILASVFDAADASNQQLQVVLLGDGTIQVFIMHYNSGGNGLYNWVGRSTGAATISQSQDFTLTVTYDGTASASGVVIRKNGVQVDSFNQNFNTFTTLGSAPTRGLQFAAQGDTPDLPIALDLGEALVYSRVLTTNELVTVHDNLATYYGIANTTPTPPPPPPSGGGPIVSIDETVGIMSGDRNGASGWGVQHTRILRNRSDGSIWIATLMDNSDPQGPGDDAIYRKKINLWKRVSQGNWVNQGITYEGGYHNPHLFQDPRGYISILSWPGGYQHIQSLQYNRARIWDSNSGTTRDIDNGLWRDHQGYGGGSEWPYAGLGVDVSGNRASFFRLDITTDNANPNIPGLVEAVYSTNGGATYSTPPTLMQTAERNAYYFVFPNGSGWTAYGTRDLSFADLGYPTPAGWPGVPFAFDEARRLDWSGEMTGNPTVTSVRAERADQAHPDNVCRVVDAYLDSSGRHHLMIYAKGPGTNYIYQTWHYVLAANGTVLGSNVIPLPFANFSRMFQDSTGRMWFLSANAWPNEACKFNLCSATDADVAAGNLGLAVSSATTVPGATVFGNTYTQNIFIATARNGGDATLRDYVDIFVAQDHIIQYYRIQVR